VDYELLKELIYHLCGIQEESEVCCNFLQSKIHPDDVNEELDEEGRKKISNELRARLFRGDSALNLEVPLLGEENIDPITKLWYKHGNVRHEKPGNFNSSGVTVESYEMDKATIVSHWMTEISQEQQKVSGFYTYMLGLINEELEVVKELAKRYFGRTDFPSRRTDFLENIYYENNGRPLDSPRNTRRRNVFSVKPLV